LFEDPAIGTLVLDQEQAIVRVNQRLETMLSAAGMALEPDMPVEALFAQADRQRVGIAIAEALCDASPPPLQVWLMAKEQACAPAVSLSVAPLRDASGEVAGLLLRFTDISAEKRLEAEVARLQKMQAIGQLAGGIAHDFNNLLMAISGAAEAVLERADCEHTTLDDVRQIRQSADKGAALARQLLAFGRRQPLLPVVVAVNEVVRKLATSLTSVLGNRVRLRLELEEPGRQVHVDPTQLDQVLINLANNARDAMPSGGTLTVRTGHLALYREQVLGTETMPPGRYVTVDVEDTGEGIPPEILPLVFDPFFTTRRERGGSGLGLSTVQGIVRQSGGFVAVESVLGQGTTVRFWLPRHEETAVVVGKAEPAAPVVVAPLKPEKAKKPPAAPPPQPAPVERLVLLVEDEESVRRLTERALQRAGWQVSSVDSAEAALEWLPRQGGAVGRPSVLVSDILLPGMDGTELVRAVRAVWPDLPAVLVSGYTDSALLGDLTAQGVSFLSKPFRLKDLVDCVERAVT
jgi:two-component system, cell cycle sensor histidine kinase and response regulator CckA